jgi:predicted ATPase
LIGGESGVGKSRLVDELRTLAMVQGALVMRGQAISEVHSPYYMWRPALRWLCLLTELSGLEATLLRTIIPDVDSLLKRTIVQVDVAQIDPQTAQNHILKALENMLRRQQQPVVMIFEDLHWAGSESLSALSQLSKMAQALPVLVIATYRDDEQPNIPSLLPEIPVLKLNRLNESAIVELSAAMLGEAGTQPQVVNLLRRETEGNVFFGLRSSARWPRKPDNLTRSA